VHVGVHGVDADHAAFGVAVRRVMHRLPPLVSDGLRQELLDGDRLALQHALEERPHLGEALAADDIGHRAAGELVALQAEPFLVVTVQEAVMKLAIDVRDARRNVVHDEAQLGFRSPQRFLRLLQLADLVEHHVDALDRAVDLVVGHHPAADPARAARRVDQRALEAHGLAGERTILVGGLGRRVLEADHFGRGLADDGSAVEPVQLEECVVDEGVAPSGIEIDDRVRNVVGEEAKLFLARGQRLLGALQVVDVVFGAVDAAELVVDIEVRRDAPVDPALLAVLLRIDALVFDVLAAVGALQHRSQERGDGRRQHLERRAPVDLLLRQVHPVGERLVDERVRRGAIEIGDRARDVVGEEPELHFLLGQRIADADVVVDVGHHREDAVDAAADRTIGEERHPHPAELARVLALAALERDLGAAEGAVDVLVHVGERAAGDQLLHAAAEQVVGCDADPVAEWLVREAQLEVAVEVDDRRADAVGDKAQAVLAPACFELEPLQLIDVGVADEEPAYFAVRAPIRVVIDVDPDGGPSGDVQLPLEARALAREGRLHVSFVKGKHFPPHDVGDQLADDVGVDLTRPFEECLVDEPVAPIAVDVGERQAQRVQLALGQRRKVRGLRNAPDLALDGREAEAGQGLRQGHGEQWVIGGQCLRFRTHPEGDKQSPGPKPGSAGGGPARHLVIRLGCRGEMRGFTAFRQKATTAGTRSERRHC